MRGYAICTQPRSGSNLFCQYLASTNRLGYPLEYFNGSGRRALGMPDYPDDPRQQIECILQLGASPNGIYGLKVFALQLDAVVAGLRWTEALPNLRFIYLERRDFPGQALSWARAQQSSQYRSTQPVLGPTQYDGPAILNCLNMIVRERARWDTFFAGTGISALRIAYEDFIVDPPGHVERVAAFMDVAEPVAVDRSGVDLAVQRDALSDAWRQRFLDEFGDPNRMDPI